MTLAGTYVDRDSRTEITISRTLTRGVYLASWRDARGRPDSEGLRADEIRRMVKKGLMTRIGSEEKQS